MVKGYLFTITISGYGENADEAWQDACEGFSMGPGPTPEENEYELVEVENEE